MAAKKDIDFFAFVRAESNIVNRDGKSLPMVLPVGLAVLLVLACWLIFSMLNISAGRKLSSIGEAPGGINASQGVIGKSVGSSINDMIRMELDYNNSSRLNHSRVKELFSLQPDDLRVLGVAYNNGEFNMSCYSSRELCGADFAKLLRESEYFEGVNYTGVTASGGGYSFSLSFSCTGETEYGNPEVEQ